MPCVPCQVAIWNGQAAGMIGGVTDSLKVAKVSVKWQKKWYAMLEEVCKNQMQPLIDELAYGKDDEAGG